MIDEMPIVIELGKDIREDEDWIQVVDWLKRNVGEISKEWTWRVSNKWYPGFGHPMEVIFLKVPPETITYFVLVWVK